MKQSSPLEKHLISRIEKEGPLSIADFMTEALYHPKYGYYTTQNPFDDFTTAPEITPLFGEAIAIWIIQTWEDMGSPSPFTLLEGGPGKGTLMSDVLRTLQKIAPTCFKAANPTLVETSLRLSQIQQEALKNYPNVTWHKIVQDVSNNHPTILIANELLDAFPIHQYQYTTNNAWAEKKITFTEAEGFASIFSPLTDTPAAFSDITPTKTNIYEHSPAQEAWITDTTQHFSSQNSSFLVIDYAIAEGDTLQALHRHKFANPLENIGKQDLTTHVNFPRLQKHLPTPEKAHFLDLSTFLIQHGFSLRISTLLDTPLPETTKKELRTVAERLLSPQHMGALFKCLIYKNF